MAAPAAAGAASGGEAVVSLWPQEDLVRLLGMLQARGVARLLATCPALHRQLQATAGAMLQVRGAGGGPALCMPAVEAQQAVESLEQAIQHASAVTGGQRGAWEEAWQKLSSLEAGLHSECRYCYGPDWDVKPGKLVSRKGTWLKVNTQFSWELTDAQKLYLPQGVVMPVLQIRRVTDPRELKRHEWVGQHIRVWMKPPIVRMLEARRGTWFVYYPHFEDKGLVIIALADTWLKRTTQMSGEMEPFEMIYVPRGLPLHLASEPVPVEEEWEKYRHQHVALHRKIVLASPPLTVKQDKYDIFVGQGDERLHPVLGAK